MTNWLKRVLLIDLDPQFNASQYILGVRRYQADCHIYREILCSGRFAGIHFHRHRLVPGNIGPSAAALLLLSGSFALSEKGDFR